MNWKYFIQSPGKISELSSIVSLFGSLFIGFQKSGVILVGIQGVYFIKKFILCILFMFLLASCILLREYITCIFLREHITRFCSFFFNCLQVLSCHVFFFLVSFCVVREARLTAATDFNIWWNCEISSPIELSCLHWTNLTCFEYQNSTMYLWIYFNSGFQRNFGMLFWEGASLLGVSFRVLLLWMMPQLWEVKNNPSTVIWSSSLTIP